MCPGVPRECAHLRAGAVRARAIATRARAVERDRERAIESRAARPIERGRDRACNDFSSSAAASSTSAALLVERTRGGLVARAR